MNQNDINQIVDELERRGFAPKYHPPEQKQSGRGGFFFLFLIIAALAGWAIFNQNDTPIQGNNTVIIQPTQEYIITELEAVILATSTPLVYPTAVLPTATTDYVQPMLQATLAGEWPRPITFEQYNACVANPDINPVCEDYLK